MLRSARSVYNPITVSGGKITAMDAGQRITGEEDGVKYELFEGYKLSLSAIGSTSVTVPADVKAEIDKVE